MSKSITSSDGNVSDSQGCEDVDDRLEFDMVEGYDKRLAALSAC
jgi:hypothetical protein